MKFVYILNDIFIIENIERVMIYLILELNFKKVLKIYFVIQIFAFSMMHILRQNSIGGPRA